jgi:hypothetical protein
VAKKSILLDLNCNNLLRIEGVKYFYFKNNSFNVKITSPELSDDVCIELFYNKSLVSDDVKSWIRSKG